MRNAMIQAGMDLTDEGYEINDAEMRNALGDAESFRPGQSLWDSVARETGQPTGEEEYDNTRSDEADRRRDENYDWTLQGRQGEMADAQTDSDSEAAEAQARQDIRSRYKYIPPGTGYGTAVELRDRIATPEFQHSEDLLDEIFTQRNINYIDDDVEEAMHSVGIPAEDVRLLKEFYSG
jgi:hypothetical protein